MSVELYVCDNCGSWEIEELHWVDPNTLEYKDYNESISISDRYCNHCGDGTGCSTTTKDFETEAELTAYKVQWKLNPVAFYV